MPVITTRMTGFFLSPKLKLYRHREVFPSVGFSLPCGILAMRRERDLHSTVKENSLIIPRFYSADFYTTSNRARFVSIGKRPISLSGKGPISLHPFDTMSIRNLRRHARLRRLLQLSTNPWRKKFFSSLN